MAVMRYLHRLAAYCAKVVSDIHRGMINGLDRLWYG